MEVYFKNLTIGICHELLNDGVFSEKNSMNIIQGLNFGDDSLNVNLNNQEDLFQNSYIDYEIEHSIIEEDLIQASPNQENIYWNNLDELDKSWKIENEGKKKKKRIKIGWKLSKSNRKNKILKNVKTEMENKLEIMVFQKKNFLDIVQI